jgi:glycosyltransferase involved in cell wall biosynthesis
MSLDVRIVAACPFPAGRGSQLLVERMTRGLQERGHRVEVVTHRFGEAGRTVPPWVVRAGLSARGRIVDSRLSLRRAIDDALVLRAALDRRPDVLIGQNVEGGVIAGLLGRWLTCPVVYVRHSHFADEIAGASRWPGTARALGRMAEGLAERLATRIVALGREGDPDPRVDWIPPPFDPDERPMRRGDGRTLYYEGNLDPYQNLAWLEVALARVREKHPDGRLVYASSPLERPECADLALVPRSLGGGFPMKLIAHQISGVPALCTASGAPGMVDGLDAFILEGEPSPQAFARRAAELIDCPELLRTVRETARARALARNAPAAVAERLERCLKRAIDAGSAPARQMATPRGRSYTSRP